MQASPFEPESEITRYYEMLPETALKERYREMLECDDPDHKLELQEELRRRAVPGSIDVNIMSKVDFRRLPARREAAGRVRCGDGRSTRIRQPARSARRSFSRRGSTPGFYTYAATFKDFLPDDTGQCKKKIILKVSDYHSAVVQGKFLAQAGALGF